MLSQRMIVSRREFQSWLGFIKNEFLKSWNSFKSLNQLWKQKSLMLAYHLTICRKKGNSHDSTASKTNSTQNCSRFVFIFSDLGPHDVLRFSELQNEARAEFL